MSLNLHWKTSVAASCWHAVEACANHRPFVQPALADALATPTAALTAAIAVTTPERNLVFEHLIPLSASIPGETELARTALAKSLGADRAARYAEPFAKSLRPARRAFETHAGDVEQELELRRGPLEQQWSARGPGLLAAVGRLSEAELLPDSADVLLVLPVLGGAGAPHVRYNSVRVEAVLADPQLHLPEIVRLGWLLAMLNLDLPRYADHFQRDRLRQLAQLALVPILLAAGQEVELTRCDSSTIATALELWHVCPTQPATEVTETLVTWWQTYLDSQSPFVTALHALDHMLPASTT